MDIFDENQELIARFTGMGYRKFVCYNHIINIVKKLKISVGVSLIMEEKAIGMFKKIIVPVLIVAVVVGIWVYKQAGKNAARSEVNDGVEWALDVTENFDFAEIISAGLPVVIDFGSDSCIPCKEIAPILQELNTELRGKALIKFVDVWKNSQAGEEFPFEMIPTQFFFDKEGKPYVPSKAMAEKNKFKLHLQKGTKKHNFTSHEGVMSKEELLAVLEELGLDD